MAKFYSSSNIYNPIKAKTTSCVMGSLSVTGERMSYQFRIDPLRYTPRFDWDQVSATYWKKYPNPYSPHVLTEDVIERKIVDRKLITTRLLKKTNKLPRWGEKLLPLNSSAYIVEESVVDPVNKRLTTYTRNINLTTWMLLEEKCEYYPSSQNSNWTICKRYAWINSSMFGLAPALKAFGYERFKANASKAIKGLTYALTKSNENNKSQSQYIITRGSNKQAMFEPPKAACT